MQESQTAQSNTGLIYGLNDRPPVREAIFAAIQHLLAIFVAIITPPLIIAGALKLDLETTSFLVSMSLFASGISTFIQCKRIGGIGTGLLCIQGTSFSFIGPIISAGMLGGVAKGAFGEAEADAKFEAWKNNKQSGLAALKAKEDEAKKAEAKARLEAEKKINEEKAKALAEKKAAEAAAKAAAEAPAEEAPAEEAPAAEEAAAE